MNIWNSIDSNFYDIFKMFWPMILISVLLLSSIRVSYLLKHKNEFVLHNELIILFFVVYILCLFQLVTFGDVNNLGSNNFIPFKEILRYKILSRLFIKNVFGNIIMFIPYGFFISLFVKENSTKKNIILVMFASFVIETTQLSIGRVFDVDDIILNVLGGFLGILLYKTFNKVGDICPKVFKSTVFLDIISVIILIIGIIYIIWR